VGHGAPLSDKPEEKERVMGRPRSKVLSDSGKRFEILKLITNEVLALGGTDEDLRRVLEPGSILAEQIAKMLTAGPEWVLRDYGYMPLIRSDLQPRAYASGADWGFEILRMIEITLKKFGGKPEDLNKINSRSTYLLKHVAALLVNGPKPKVIVERTSCFPRTPCATQESLLCAESLRWGRINDPRFTSRNFQVDPNESGESFGAISLASFDRPIWSAHVAAGLIEEAGYRLAGLWGLFSFVCYIKDRMPGWYLFALAESARLEWEEKTFAPLAFSGTSGESLDLQEMGDYNLRSETYVPVYNR